METGGYFGWEQSNFHAGGLHDSSRKLNTGRNCLEYILAARKYKKIYIPYYTCEVILEPIHKLNIDYEFYRVDQNLEPVTLPNLKEGDSFLYINYFGLKSSYIHNQLQSLGQQLIIDNSQALFSTPSGQSDCFYSLRKFAGVADGAFLYCSEKITGETWLQARSEDRSSHLYIRNESGAQMGYADFISNENKLSGLPIQTMSENTLAFIKNYDFEKNKCIRQTNFLYLHSRLQKLNTFEIDLKDLEGPLCYPFLPQKRNTRLKQFLIGEQIYVPTFWPKVLTWLPSQAHTEADFVNNLICLPIDQRYTLPTMDLMVEKIISFYAKN